MRIVVLAGSFELGAIRANQRGEFADRGTMPGGFAVIGFDQADIPDDQFGVIAIGQLGVKGVGSVLAICGVKGAFDDYCCCFRESFGAALRFNVLVYDFLRVLSACGLSENNDAKGGGYCQSAIVHGRSKIERNSRAKVSLQVRNHAELFVNHVAGLGTACEPSRKNHYWALGRLRYFSYRALCLLSSEAG